MAKLSLRSCALAGALLIGLVIRIALRDYTTGDTAKYLLPWYEFARGHGWRALAYPFTNYTPPYSYALIAVSRLDGLAPPLMLIKAISWTFELGNAALGRRIVLDAGGTRNRATAAFAALWLAPTVLFDGAAWGQCDAMWEFFLLLSIWCFMHRRNGAAALGAAFAVKVPGVFLGPFVLGLIWRRELRWTALLWLPGMYLACAAPALLAGRPLLDVLRIYADQANTFDSLSMNAASMWAPLANSVPYGPGVLTGLALAAVGGLALAWLMTRVPLQTPEALLLAATCSLMLCPFLLPKMQDRYFYGFEVAAIVLAAVNPRYLVVALVAQITGVIAYLTYVDISAAAVKVAAFINGALLWILIERLAKSEKVSALHNGRPAYRPASSSWPDCVETGGIASPNTNETAAPPAWP